MPMFIQFCFLLLFAAKPEKREPLLPSMIMIESSLNQLPVFSCNFTGRPEVDVTWSYSDKIKGFDSSIHHGGSKLTWTTGFLKITFVPNVCMTYEIRCSGQNEFGKAEQTILLNVTGR